MQLAFISNWNSANASDCYDEYTEAIDSARFCKYILHTRRLQRGKISSDMGRDRNNSCTSHFSSCFCRPFRQDSLILWWCVELMAKLLDRIWFWIFSYEATISWMIKTMFGQIASSYEKKSQVINSRIVSPLGAKIKFYFQMIEKNIHWHGWRCSIIWCFH